MPTETATPIGTGGANAAGPARCQLHRVTRYWGIEGGHRWYFARTRFTPYLGYLVGINRHQDIQGTFVGVPTSATPGLAAQDGKFFEKSWALSLGPTGGMLIGVGPIEVMAELQFRYLGGLSDVDWLIEEGLKDINDESARWSYPIRPRREISILILPEPERASDGPAVARSGRSAHRASRLRSTAGPTIRRGPRRSLPS